MNEGAGADQGAALAAAAAEMIGSPFRLHGRDPSSGLDCVGLVVAALTATGARPQVPVGYSLRNLSVDHWLHFMGRSGLMPAPGPVRTGDVLLIVLSHCQHHLAIAEGDASVIHAHAGLRRVVRQPMESHWQVRAKWRAAPVMKG